MALDSPKLKDVLREVGDGRLQLPDFQRDWKWDDDRIRALLATVTLNYPLGVVMTLKTGGKSPFKSRPLSGAEPEAGQAPEQLLLDGQQRLTSLFQAFSPDRVVETSDSRGKALRRWYYVDIERAVKSGADRDEAIFSVPEERVLRTDFGRTVVKDLSTQTLECQAGLFPVHLAFDAQRVSAWQKEYVQLDGAHWDRWATFQDQVLHNILAFQIPMISLDADTPKDAVCSVFERVNTGGVPLNVFELLTATYAGDARFEPEYRLPDVWQDIRKSLGTTYPVLGRLENSVENGLTSSDFLQAVCLVRTYERKRDGLAAAVSCKRKDLLNLPLDDFVRLAPLVRDAFLWVGDFLNRQCIFWTEDIPYRTQLVPLAAARALLGEQTDDPDRAALISTWYWCGVLGEMYGGSFESRFPRDVEQLVSTEYAHPLTDTVTEAAFLAERLDTLATRNSAAYKGVYALLIKQGAVDWYYSEAQLDQATVVGQSVEPRQIFPKNWFVKVYGEDDRMTSIVNKTPLSHRASRNLAGAPSAYMRVMAREAGYPEDWFDDVLDTHLIDSDLLRADDFDAFYRTRAERLLELIEDAMGKPVVRRGGAG